MLNSSNNAVWLREVLLIAPFFSNFVCGPKIPNNNVYSPKAHFSCKINYIEELFLTERHIDEQLRRTIHVKIGAKGSNDDVISGLKRFLTAKINIPLLPLEKAFYIETVE